MVRASALHAEGQRFESSIAQFPVYGAPPTEISESPARSEAAALYPDRSEDLGPRRVIC